tara:strand:- start:9996 stop:10487 length:492 start_codon:yes stop_codon:yes gene_type:complete
MRLALLPLFAITLINSKLDYSLVIFIIMALSDRIDGISAKLGKQVTEFGKSFDSFTDWSVFLTTFILLAVLGYIDSIWVLLLIFPVIMMLISKIIFLKKHKKIIVTMIARISVGMAYVTIISILMDFIYQNQILILTFILIYISMFKYLIMAYNFINSSKKAS